MHHTSIRITDDLYELVAATGKPTSVVVRDALASYFGIDLTDKGKETLQDWIQDLIDERLEDHVKEYNHVRDKNALSDTIKAENVARALELIQTLHNEGKEPTVGQVAKEIGIESRSLGRLLKTQGIETKLTKRKGKSGRYIMIGSIPEI